MKKYSLLIADEDKSICNSLSAFFEDNGYKVFTANSYDEAIRIVKLHAPNLILLDSQLSSIDGIQILKDIKSLKQDILVIMFLRESNLEFAVKATRHGVYDLIEKPLSPERVLFVVKLAFEKQS